MRYNTYFGENAIDEIMDDQRSFLKSLLSTIDSLKRQNEILHDEHVQLMKILEVTGIIEKYEKELEMQKKKIEIQNSGNNYDV